MLPNIDKNAVLKWFTGKARERVEHALFLVSESEAEGFWVPGASRKVRAALNKSNVVKKWMGNGYRDPDCNGKILEGMRYPRKWEDDHDEANDGKTDGFRAYMAISYGQLDRLMDLKLSHLKKLAKTDRQKEAFAFVQSYYDDFIELAKLLRRLDDARPKPVFTSIGVSRTITKTLEDARLDLNINTIRICPHKTEWREMTFIDKKTKKPYTRNVPVMILLWPKGTKHDCSRFATYTHQCHSCGHAIHNPSNWVPILIDSKAGVPHSLWIGRDCAHRVFGIKVTGDLTIQGGKTGGVAK